jgi:hypothetical protein
LQRLDVVEPAPDGARRRKRGAERLEASEHLGRNGEQARLAAPDAPAAVYILRVTEVADRAGDAADVEPCGRREARFQ